MKVYLRILKLVSAAMIMVNATALSASQLTTIEDAFNYATVQIKTASGSGTGFFFSFDATPTEQIPCLITNKHVKRDSTEGSIVFHSQNLEGNPEGMMECVVSGDLWRWIDHPGEVDLSALLLGPVLQKMDSEGFRPFWRHLTRDNMIIDELLDKLTPVSDILMVGYPIALVDDTNNFPIFRQGITATHPGVCFKGKSEFLIDAACWPGSSGSPVFLRGNPATRDRSIRIGSGGPFEGKLLGVLWGGPQYTTTGEIVATEIPMVHAAVPVIPANLGFVIHSGEILQVGDEVLKKLLTPAPVASDEVVVSSTARLDVGKATETSALVSSEYMLKSLARGVMACAEMVRPVNLVRFTRSDLTGIPRLTFSQARVDFIKDRNWDAFTEAAQALAKEENPSFLGLRTIAFNLLEIVNENTGPLSIIIVGEEEAKKIDQLVVTGRKLFYLDLNTLYDSYVVEGSLPDGGFFNVARSDRLNYNQAHVKVTFKKNLLRKLEARLG